MILTLRRISVVLPQIARRDVTNIVLLHRHSGHLRACFIAGTYWAPSPLARLAASPRRARRPAVFDRGLDFFLFQVVPDERGRVRGARRVEGVHRVVHALQHDRHGGGHSRRAGRQPAVARPAGYRPQAAGAVRPASGLLRSPRRPGAQSGPDERRGREADCGRTLRAGRSAGHAVMIVFGGRVAATSAARRPRTAVPLTPGFARHPSRPARSRADTPPPLCSALE